MIDVFGFVVAWLAGLAVFTVGPELVGAIMPRIRKAKNKRENAP